MRLLIVGLGAVVAAAAVTACDTGEGGDSPGENDAGWSRELPLAPGSFVEANFVMGAGGRVTATFAATGGAVEWDLHEHDPEDLSQFVVLESGAGAADTLSFSAAHAGLFSYQWSNPLEAPAVRLDVALALEGDARLHSWGP